MGAPVTWFEISTEDAAAAREFYAEQFGWKLQVIDGINYALVDTHPGGIGGGIGEAQGPNQVIFYIEVSDPRPRSTGSRRPAARRSCRSPRPTW